MTSTPIEPPSAHPDDEPLVSFCVNRTWIPYILGMIYPARYPEYWGGTLEQNRTARKDVLTLLSIIQGVEECDDMKNCCVDALITYRTDPVTGNIQQSTDGGVTWEPAAGGIQTVIVQPVPPVTNGVAATKCDAATNVSGQVQVWIDQVTSDFDTATTLFEFAEAVVLAIVAAVLAILTAGALTAVEAAIIGAISAALTAVWGAGKVVFENYWTTDVKDAILCAAYCNIGDDGSFTAAQFSAFWNQVNGDLPPSPAKMLFMGFLSSIGMPGLNAMAASGLSADADCSDCPCAPCAAKFSVVSGGGTLISRGDDYLECDPVLSGGQYYLFLLTANENVCCSMSEIELVSGSMPTLIGWTDCGVTPSVGAPQHTGLYNDGGVGSNYIQLQSASPYSVKVHFIPPP